MKKVSSKAKVAAGLGVGLAVATAVVGAYFLHGKKGAKTRRQVKSWMLKARAEVMDQIEQAKSFNQRNYNQAIQAVAAKYSQLKNIDPREVDLLVKELRGHWRRISKHVAKSGAPKARRRKARKPR
ncbi:MAG: YtxH domain-containing protein [Candidatus Liptonbacteria bacterium]|nr:YtxH domain-containing protein [Candidatus Liptonbacteria bacterium]